MYKYDIVSRTDLVELQKDINDYARSGWRVVGFSAAVSIMSIMYFACLERKVNDKTN